MSDALQNRLLAVWVLGVLATVVLIFVAPDSLVTASLAVLLVGTPAAGVFLYLLCSVLWATFYALRYGEWPS